MQVVSPSSPAQQFAGKERFSEVFGKLNNDFGSKLKIGSTTEQEHRDHEKSWWNQKDQTEDKERDQEEQEEEEEFSFASLNAENSPITAEEAFEDGQIRPVYPLFNRNLLYDDPKEETLRSPLKKLFVEATATTTTTAEHEEDEEEPMGPYCSWKGRTVVEASPETCRKSNSTGFSKLWRFKDLVLRSNSDGKDAFVFLSNGRDDDKNQPTSSSSSVKSKKTEKEKTKTEKEKKKKKMRTKSAHEKLYMRNRAMREEGKRRSFLPYKHVGFFTNVNGLTRNVNPF